MILHLLLIALLLPIQDPAQGSEGATLSTRQPFSRVIPSEVEGSQPLNLVQTARFLRSLRSVGMTHPFLSCIDGTTIKTLAEQVLAIQFPGEAHRLEVRVKRTSSDFAEDATLRVVFPAKSGLPRGTTQVQVLAARDEDGWQKVGWALLYIAHFDSVLVAHTAFRAGEEVTLANASVTWMETTSLPSALLRLPDLETLFHNQPVFATRSIAEGRVLRRSDVREAYAAETGGSVVMRYQRGGITFDLSCKARESGHVDDVIRLYSSDTDASYRARLTEPGMAQWLETL